MERRSLDRTRRKAPQELLLVKAASWAGTPAERPVRAQSILAKIRLVWVCRRVRRYRRLCRNVQREVCEYLVEHIIPRIWRSTLVRLNMQTSEKSKATLAVAFETTAVFCTLDEDSILCVGGKDRVTATSYILSVASAQLTEQESLITPRAAPGIVKCDRFVYVFGGWDAKTQALKASEKFGVATGSWTALRSMLQPRSYFSPCVCGSDIYLPGTGLALEVFSTLTEEFKTLPVGLTEFDESRSVSFISDGQLIVITGKNQIGKWRVNSDAGFTMATIHMNDSNSCRSNIPPLRREKTIVWVRGNDGALIKFNLSNETLVDA